MGTARCLTSRTYGRERPHQQQKKPSRLRLRTTRQAETLRASASTRRSSPCALEAARLVPGERPLRLPGGTHTSAPSVPHGRAPSALPLRSRSRSGPTHSSSTPHMLLAFLCHPSPSRAAWHSLVEHNRAGLTPSQGSLCSQDHLLICYPPRCCPSATIRTQSAVFPCTKTPRLSSRML